MNHLSQLLMPESSPETQGCWKARDTVHVCSYVHIWLRLGFRFEPYCAVHWAVTSRCSPTSPCPCELKSSVCKPLSWVFPRLAYQYSNCFKMNGPHRGDSHLWIRFGKWVLRGVISAPMSQCAAGVLPFVLFLTSKIFKNSYQIWRFYKNNMCLSLNFFFSGNMSVWRNCHRMNEMSNA